MCAATAAADANRSIKIAPKSAQPTRKYHHWLQPGCAGVCVWLDGRIDALAEWDEFVLAANPTRFGPCVSKCCTYKT
jgi:hypothetical protein